MEVFAEYLARIDNPQHRVRMEEVYDHSKELVLIPWDSLVDLSLLEKMIEFNILDKTECSTFWRK